MTDEVSTLDLVTGPHAILTADPELGARADRAAAAAGLPVIVTTLDPSLMRSLGADLVVVRPDQVVAATWPARTESRAGNQAPTQSDTESPDTTMALLCGRQGADTTWTRTR